MESFNAQRRSQTLRECRDQTLDVIVVGGGITGAGIFLEAAHQGLNVALFEKDDFASATSSASSKLIHGGLRYIELLDLGLVHESCNERKRLLELAPELVQPLGFTFPVFDGQRRGLWTIYAGTWIYYMLAMFRNIGKPEKLSTEQTSLLFPKLNRRELQGSVQYYDASTIDSRLTLATVKTGCALGGHAVNHAKVISYIRENKRVVGVEVEDQITKEKYSIRAKWVVNALGPWTDPTKIRMTKGVHIIVKGNPFEIKTAVVMLSPSDGRVLFLIPWCGQTLIGTTDTDYKGTADELRVERSDLEYLLRAAQYYFPTVVITRDDILSTFAGLRCLRHESEPHPSDVSREQILYSDETGLLNIAGGKLTTYLAMGKQVIGWLKKKDSSFKKTNKTPYDRLVEVSPSFDLQSPSEIKFQHLIRHEMAVTIRDLLQHRTLAYYLTQDNGASLIELASRAIRNELGFSEDEIQRQIREYEAEIKKQHV
ncbi:MAG: glycerol-3-phosphate dehydrogenase/oxidase [Proteobacteria bacterium]|nr:glycerol-3-phosphate dehydrogenase/oxidase [Pseudomonadota bacterium]